MRQEIMFFMRRCVVHSSGLVDTTIYQLTVEQCILPFFFPAGSTDRLHILADELHLTV